MLNDLRFRTKLWLVLGVPTAALMFTAANIMVERVGQAREMGDLERVATLTASATTLIHEVQEERARATGLLSGVGSASGFQGQHGATDEAVEAYRVRVEEAEGAIDEELAEKLASVDEALADLASARTTANAAAGMVNQIAFPYNQINRTLIEVVKLNNLRVFDTFIVVLFIDEFSGVCDMTFFFFNPFSDMWR